MQSFLAAVFVLAALWAAVLFLRKKGFATTVIPMKRRSRSIEQIDALRLTPQHTIHLVRANGRDILLAAHPRGVQILESSTQTYARLGDAQ